MSDHNKHCDCVPEMAKAIAVRDAKIADLQADVDALRAEAASEERWADEYNKQVQALQAEVGRLNKLLYAAKSGLMSYAYGNISRELAEEILKHMEGGE